MGTADSPGHHVVTVVGDVARPGVDEIELGMPLSEVIATVGGGPRPGRTVKAVFSGVSNAVVTADKLGTPLTYEAIGGRHGAGRRRVRRLRRHRLHGGRRLQVLAFL